jgi:hypothetical protein
VRIVWMRPDDAGELVAGIQFLDARPAFLPTLYRWMGRETGLGPA